MTYEDLQQKRLSNWCQDGRSRVPDPSAAVEFINRVGISPLFQASAEFPDLHHAYVGSANAPVDSKWDSPSGHVYSWRWSITALNGGFYGGLVAKKPTWVAWDHLPDVLAALMDRRTPDELYDLGVLSASGYRIAQAFEGTDGVLTTKELRQRAGFPTGKENRAAYLKAVEELESFTLIAKRPGKDDSEDMSHIFIPMGYREAFETALNTPAEVALAQVLKRYLEHAIYIDPKPFARAIRKTVGEVTAVLRSNSIAQQIALDGKQLLVSV